MNIGLAHTMAHTAFDANRTLKAQLSENNYQSAAHDLAIAIDHVNTALLARAIAAYPALEQEIDSAIRDTGRF